MQISNDSYKIMSLFGLIPGLRLRFQCYVFDKILVLFIFVGVGYRVTVVGSSKIR